ncbi:Uncharacterized protein APZ42_003984 [Daphnia magna]|uniref:Uncharacterized protein n=1 Tax=Daphnia magna TaxID=35525 RepID=A0A162C1J6_9CRUS|nr:Uncharacterized protein APZ42_003984 [Daphnia magna]
MLLGVLRKQRENKRKKKKEKGIKEAEKGKKPESTGYFLPNSPRLVGLERPSRLTNPCSENNFIPILTLSRNHLFTCFALSMMKRMLSAQEDSDTCVAFMKIANACVADGNVLPGNYSNWIPQPEQDSAISTTFEEDPEDSDGNDEPIEDETGADITDLDSDDNDDDQPSSGPTSSLTINPPSPLPNSTSQRPTTLLLNPPTPNAKEEFPVISKIISFN